MKQNYLKSFCARFLTLLVLALMSTNLAWGAEGDVLAEVQGTGSGYGRQTTTDSHNVGWVTIGQSGYFGINSAANNTGAKAGVNATDLPVAKAVNANATSSTSTTSNSCTGYYTFYTTTALKNVGSIEFYYSANSGNKNATAYVVMGDAKSASGGAAYVQVPLATSSTSKQGVSLGESGKFTFTFAETQKVAKYYGVVIATTSYKRMTGGKITIKEGAGDDPSKELVSIAISGTPKTTYETGESFDVTGLTVTGTYSDNSTDNVTDNVEWTIDPTSFTSTTQNSVSVTATVDGKSDTKNYTVTVNEHIVTPGTYDIALNNAFWGTSYNGTFSLSANSLDLNGTSNDVALKLKNGTSTNGYITDDQTRAYNGYSLKFTAPTGYELQSIVFTQASGKDWKGTLSADKGEMGTDNKTWSGNSNDVTISFSGTCVIEKVTVTYAAPKVVSGIAVKNNPTKTTYYVGDEFDPAGLVITASYESGDPEDIAYTEANKDAFSFSGFNSEDVATDQVITVTYAEKSATFTINIETERTLNSITVASKPSKMVYEVGEALDLTGLVVNGIFSKGDPEPVEYTADPADGTTLDAVGTTTVTLTSVDNTELTTSFDVTVKAIEGDRITLTETGVSGGYAAWTDSYTGPSGAVYTGLNAGGNSAIQLRSDATGDKPASGIISTMSGGNIAKVKVVWESHTTNERELEVFGSNTAYTAVADLVDNTKKGTSLGTIKNGTSTELEIDGKYAYVGVRSKSGAMYLTSITFVWKEEETYTRTVTSGNFGTICLPYGGVIEGADLYSVAGVDNVDEPSVLYLEPVEGNTAVAGMPYIFKATSTTLSVDYTGEQVAEAGIANGLVGSYTKETIAAGAKNYILNNNQWKYVPEGNTNYVGANKAYLDLSKLSASSKSEVDMLFDSEPTGIEAVSLKSAFLEGIEIYNLNGVRVNENYKGIVIVNGKKYINK